MNMSAVIKIVEIGKNKVIKVEANVNGWHYDAYCPKGHYEYNEIASEAQMFFNIWAQAASADEMVRDGFTDAYPFIEKLSSNTNREAILKAA